MYHNDSCDMDFGCMHANENNTLPTCMDAEIMKSTDLRDHKCNRPNVVGKDEDYCS